MLTEKLKTIDTAITTAESIIDEPKKDCENCHGVGHVIQQLPEQYAKLIGRSEIAVECYCHGKLVREGEIERLKAERARVQSQLSYLIRKFGSVYSEKSLDNYSDVSPKVKIERFISGEYGSKGLYLFGPSGSGKTHLAAAIYNRLASAGKSVCVVKCDQFDALMSDYDNPSKERVLHAAQTAAVLIMDDIGLGKLTHERQLCYYSVIDYRTNNAMPTVFTSNLTTPNLWAGSEVSPDRLVRRIQDNCIGIECKKVAA